MFGTLSAADIDAFESLLRRTFTYSGTPIEAHNSNFLMVVSQMKLAGCFPGYAAATRTYFSTFLNGPHASLFAAGIDMYNLLHPAAYTPRPSEPPDRAPHPHESHLTTAMPHMLNLVRQKASTIRPNPYAHARSATSDDTDPTTDQDAALAASTSVNLSITGPPKLIQTLTNDLPTDRDPRTAPNTNNQRNRPSNNNSNSKSNRDRDRESNTRTATTNRDNRDRNRDNYRSSTTSSSRRPRYCFTCGMNPVHSSKDCPRFLAGTGNPGHHTAATQFNYEQFPGAATPIK